MCCRRSFLFPLLTHSLPRFQHKAVSIAGVLYSEAPKFLVLILSCIRCILSCGFCYRRHPSNRGSDSYICSRLGDRCIHKQDLDSRQFDDRHLFLSYRAQFRPSARHLDTILMSKTYRIRNDRFWPFSPGSTTVLGRLLSSQQRTGALHNGIFTIDPPRTKGAARKRLR